MPIDPSPASDLLHGGETAVYADSCYQRVDKREEMQGRGFGFRVALQHRKLRVFLDTPEGLLDNLVQTTKSLTLATVEHLFREINRQFSFQLTQLRGMFKYCCKIHEPAVHFNLLHGSLQVAIQLVIGSLGSIECQSYPIWAGFCF
jgi:IS5 family transposase